MFTVELSVLLVLSMVLGVGTLVQSLRTALPRIAELRRALEDCPVRH